MDRYLIDNYGNSPDMVEFGIRWLAERGGGSIVMPIKRNYLAVFNCRTDKDFKRLEQHMSALGITLQTQRGGFLPTESMFAIYPTGSLLEDIESKESIDELLVLGWTDYEYGTWKEKHHPTAIDGGNEKPDWADRF